MTAEFRTQEATMRKAALVLATLMAACSGAPESSINKIEPKMSVAPAALDFGVVVQGVTVEQTLQIVNTGRVDLDITEIAVVDNDGSFTITPTTATVGSALDESNNLTIGVSFTPAAIADYTRTLIIRSNDGDTPDLEVPIAASGRAVPVPDIDVGDGLVDFGNLIPGDRSQAFLDLRNVGEAPLLVTNIAFSGSGAFTLVSPPAAAAGFETAPGGSNPMVFEYAPTGIDGDTTQLTLFTNDPDEPEVQVELRGNGGSDFEYPEAVIDCPTGVEPLQTVTLSGAASVDPMGGGLSYLWSLTDRPSSSATALSVLTGPTTDLLADVAGEYEVQLRVTNDVGLTSAPAICRFDSVPANQLHVELYWDAADADLDLHLVERGYTFYQSPGDCNWCNEAPDWGVAGVSTDDPWLALDVDESVGYGPENIVIPVPSNGDYDVMVHYFSDHGAGELTATAVIWLDGRKVKEIDVRLEHNEVWNAGYIRWPEKVFVESREEPTPAARRSCSTAP
jgi:hypothetical protein